MQFETSAVKSAIMFTDVEGGVGIELLPSEVPEGHPVTQGTLVAGAIVLLMHDENPVLGALIREKIEGVFLKKPNILH